MAGSSITAAKEVWIGAGGSYIQINGSGIINGSPGPILEKAHRGTFRARMPSIPEFRAIRLGHADRWSHPFTV